MRLVDREVPENRDHFPPASAGLNEYRFIESSSVSICRCDVIVRGMTGGIRAATAVVSMAPKRSFIVSLAVSSVRSVSPWFYFWVYVPVRRFFRVS
jgi:hypothetical protein